MPNPSPSESGQAAPEAPCRSGAVETPRWRLEYAPVPGLASGLDDEPRDSRRDIHPTLPREPEQPTLETSAASRSPNGAHLRTPKREFSHKVKEVANADLSIDSKLPPGLNPPAPIDVERLRARARQIKESKGLSIQDLVMASGLSRTAVLDMLNGRGRVAIGRVDTWWALAWALEVPFSELMRSLDEPAEGADRTPPGTDASR